MEQYGDMGNGAKQDEKGVLRGLAANMGPDLGSKIRPVMCFLFYRKPKPIATINLMLAAVFCCDTGV